MTSIIDTLYVPDLNLNKKYRRGSLSFRSISIQKETPKKRIQQTQINSFIIPGKNGKFDLFFNVEFLQPQTSVKIFLISKLGHILKASSEIAKVELIRIFFNQTQFYRPSVNPLTGFLFFKIDVFTFGKRKSDFKQSNKAEWVLKGIDIKKLVSSIKNLHLCEKILQFNGCDGWYADQQKNRFASVKQIARTIQGKNLYQSFTDKQKKVSSGTQQSRNQQIQQLQDLFLSQKVRQTPLNIQNIIQSVKQVEKTRPYLGTFIRTKGRRSNFDTLFISAPTRNKINEQINIMLENNIQKSTLKISEQSYENAVLKLEKIPPIIFQKRKQFFSHLKKLHAYDQIDKYFDSQLELPIQISLDSRCESLPTYLQKNGNVISLETKLRILIQIFTFVNVLWEENELVFLLNNIKDVFLTKKLCVKMRGLEDFFKSDKQMVWEDFDLVNRKRSESILNLSDLYFKLFYNRYLHYIRPIAFSKLNKQFSERWRLVEINKIGIGNDLPKDVISKTKELLTSLNYLFSQQVNAAGKKIKKMNIKQQINGMMEREQKFQWIKNSQRHTDCQSDEQSREKNLSSTAILSTRYVACWLMKNM